jgi:ABC-type branched-chain amino acid transport systems, ATPase component
MLLQVEEMISGTWSRPLTLTVDVGEIVLLIGRNGAGKTTLLNTIAGLVPIRSGCVTIDGHSHFSFLKRERRLVGIALEGRQVFNRLSVQKNLLLGAYGRIDDVEVTKDLQWILSLFPELEEKIEMPARTLSGGQQTMLNIGRALMGRPKLLLMDEPTLGLAPQTVDRLVSAINEIRGHWEVGIVVAEQSGPFIRAFPHRLVLMVGGEVLFDGHWDQARQHGMLAEIFA